MATEYERLRARMEAEIAEPGPVTKDEIRVALKDTAPAPGDDFADPDFDSSDFA